MVQEIQFREDRRKHSMNAMEVLAHVQQLFIDHTKDEMDRYDLILRQIKEANDNSLQRHEETQERINHLNNSITTFIAGHQTTVAEILEAFTEDDRGKKDFSGHRRAHNSRIAWAKTKNELTTGLIKAVLIAATLAFFAWVGLAMWIQFLRGPQ